MLNENMITKGKKKFLKVMRKSPERQERVINIHEKVGRISREFPETFMKVLKRS